MRTAAIAKSGIKQNKVYIRYANDLDYFDLTDPVTVQRYIEEVDGDTALIWCNHAGATVEEYENEIHFPEGPDRIYTASQHVCDKCGAYRHLGEDYWNDAPYEGVHSNG